ncbi:hypothetical protein PPL_02060 [Heterostelium album PN500]|uniref:TLDc domain-containing protein n=1 Tax=Heterostelium pallidum (strain ATCC 26659 / Pp 5 / PN500) TaxID=670386 RepID=D3B189_HETP5|nr:hypothetical protein PPL_02060 [Heterostelium album PN500]EFA85063.1 hypothetical protein PPL_02060 [Heterostelium album PN500]|eukprot:XP_020437173.1 hypothetical protein PPL_02060 [Heterostelium album PN500]
MLSTKESFISLGSGGKGVGLWIDEELFYGSSNRCETFNNDILAHSSDFKLIDLEVWSPVLKKSDKVKQTNATDFFGTTYTYKPPPRRFNAFVSADTATTTTIVSPTDSLVHYVGRFDKGQSDQYYGFSWSGCQIIVNITGTTQIGVVLNSQLPNWFDIYIDGSLYYRPFNVSAAPPQQQQIALVDNLDSSKTYVISISKRTEAEFGEVRFYGFSVDPTYSLNRYNPPTTRKFEFIGDSIATGYGDMGKSPCSFTESTENVDLSFAAVITNELLGEMNMAAWQGKGVIKNYGSSTPTSTETLPDLYPFILPLSDNSSYWNPTEFVPDVLVVNLGANDYTDPPYPTQQQFESTFISFIKVILAGYYPSQPKLFFICGVMIGDPVTCTYTENVANVFNATYIDMPNIQDSSSDFGCDGHPTVSAHAHMAAIAIPIIKQKFTH